MHNRVDVDPTTLPPEPFKRKSVKDIDVSLPKIIKDGKKNDNLNKATVTVTPKKQQSSQVQKDPPAVPIPVVNPPAVSSSDTSMSSQLIDSGAHTSEGTSSTGSQPPESAVEKKSLAPSKPPKPTARPKPAATKPAVPTKSSYGRTIKPNLKYA